MRTPVFLFILFMLSSCNQELSGTKFNKKYNPDYSPNYTLDDVIKDWGIPYDTVTRVLTKENSIYYSKDWKTNEGKEYYFNLGKITWKKLKEDYDDPYLHSDNDEMTQIGRILFSPDGKPLVSNTEYLYQKPSLCECLTESDRSRSEICESIFRQRYGTGTPSTDMMKEDYNNCKN